MSSINLIDFSRINLNEWPRQMTHNGHIRVICTRCRSIGFGLSCRMMASSGIFISPGMSKWYCDGTCVHHTVFDGGLHPITQIFNMCANQHEMMSEFIQRMATSADCKAIRKVFRSYLCEVIIHISVSVELAIGRDVAGLVLNYLGFRANVC